MVPFLGMKEWLYYSLGCMTMTRTGIEIQNEIIHLVTPILKNLVETPQFQNVEGIFYCSILEIYSIWFIFYSWLYKWCSYHGWMERHSSQIQRRLWWSSYTPPHQISWMYGWTEYSSWECLYKYAHVLFGGWHTSMVPIFIFC